MRSVFFFGCGECKRRKLAAYSDCILNEYDESGSIVTEGLGGHVYHLSPGPIF